MSMMQSLFNRLPENRAKHAFRFWVADSGLAPQVLRRTCPLVGYEYAHPLQPGEIVVDAGAFSGDYTLYASRKVGPRGRVIAFEPDPENLRRLRRNLGSEAANVTIVEKGLWSYEGEVAFRMGVEGFTSGAVEIANRQAASQEIRVPVVRLDDELKRLGVDHIDVLKMDIEGAELEALRGAEQTLRSNAAHVCIATYHILDGHPTSGRVESGLRSWGYECITSFPCHATTYAWKPTARVCGP